MRVNTHKLVVYPFIALCLAVGGCSQAPKSTASISEQFDYPANGENYAGNRPHARTRLRFNRQRPANPALANTVWDRLLALYSLPDIDNRRIDKEIEWYLQHPTSLAIIQQRAEPYLHYILDEVEAKRIPGELALLPVVESAFKADAYSRADASGLWQFIPSTGEEYGLRQDAWYDGRRDVYASTKAATTYLKELSENFDGDWLLALASYNCGKNRVRRSVEHNEAHNLPTDFWSLNLPKETMDYVPKLLAVAKIFANADSYNLHLRHIPNKPYFEPVDINGPLDLHKAAQLANTPYDKFLKLNPGFNRSCTAPQGPHRLLIPVDNVQTFKQNLARLPFNERVDFSRLERERERAYTPPPPRPAPARPEPTTMQTAANSRHLVRPGDTLSSIAQRAGISVAELRKLNHLKDNTARLGSYLNIPAPPGQSKALAAKSVPAIPIPKAGVGKTNIGKAPGHYNEPAPAQYTVKRGDTLWSVAQRFSVPPKDLAAWNKMAPGDALLAGKKLSLKAPTPARQQYASASPSFRLVHYTVGKGDTLTKIARRFNVSIDDLRKSNPDLSAKYGVRLGQKLRVIISDGSPT